MSGGAIGTSGEGRRLQLYALLALFFYVLVQTWANVNSIIADRRIDGVAVDARETWALELTSLAAWLILMPLIWRLVRDLRPPRHRWLGIVVGHAFAAGLVSFLHVALMVAFREALWAANGADYVFAGPLGDSLAYEARKDMATYVEGALIFALIQWVGANAVRLGWVRGAMLDVRDGGITHQVPMAEIERVESAANYCEIHWRGRTLLHRATLASIEETLAPHGFVKVHRGRLVRRDAVRKIVSLPSGDAELELVSGELVRASRRYRKALESDFA